MNRFAEPSFVQIGIRIVCEFQNLQRGIGIVFDRWDLLMNNSQIPKTNFFCKIFLFNSFFLILLFFHLKNLQGKQSHSELYKFSLYIFNFKIRYSWILWIIFVIGNNIHQITLLANRNNIPEMKLWYIGIGIYSWPEYQQLDLWQMYLQTICELFPKR